MKTYNYLIIISFIILNFICSNESLNREKRQLYYGDIKSKPKPFRSRAEEKNEATNNAEESISIKTDLSPGSLSKLFASSNILTNPSPDGSPFKQSNTFAISDDFEVKPIYEDQFFSPKPIGKPTKHKPKPTFEEYEESFNLRPKPAYEEPFHPKPTFGKQIRHKPKPAYEEPYVPHSFAENDNLFPQASVGIHGGNQDYNSRATFASSQSLAGSAHISKPIQHANQYQDIKEEKKNPIPGIAGQDYPIYNEVPRTSFTCNGVPFRPGMYANPETGCQAYHVCHDNRHGHQGASFLCTNGTVFNQETFNCDWWYKVDCSQATSLYSLNSDPEFNPYYKKPFEEIAYKQPVENTGYKRSSENLEHKREASVQFLKPIIISNSVQETHLPPTFREIEEPKSFSTPFTSGFFSPINREIPSHQTPLNQKSNPSKPQNSFSSHQSARKETEERPNLSPQNYNPNRRTFEVEEKAEHVNTFEQTFEDRSTSFKAEGNNEDTDKISFKRPSTTSSSTSTKRILRRRRPRPYKAAVKPSVVSESTQTGQPVLPSILKRKSAQIAQFRESNQASDDLPDDIILDFEWGQRTT